MEIKDLDYEITFQPESTTVFFSGSIRLQNLPSYEPIKVFLRDAAKQSEGKTLRLDFRKLEFVNSSGITTFSMFIIDSRKLSTYQVHIIGSKNVSWQQKSLSNFKKLWDKVILDVD